MIVVTGASRGLGFDICSRLINRGRNVVGLARDARNLGFESYSCDVASYDELKDTSKKIKKKHGNVQVLINAAGVASMNLAMMTPPKVTQELIQTNLIGTIYSCQVFGPLLVKNQGGSIINFSTIAVRIGLPGESVYVASKAGVEGFSRAFAREMSNFNIRVNCIAPGPINTRLIKGVEEQLIQEVISKQILKKKFEPTDVSDIVEMLIDDKSHSLSGQVFHVGGA